MFPHFGSLLGHAPSARYMLVRSGTSRLIVLDGNEIRSGAAGRREILKIMRGADDHGGLGGPTLQDNKVALVWPETKPAEFRFRFLQVIPTTGDILPMECSNSASAAAMLAQLGGHHRGHASKWQAINLSSNQKIELAPEPNHGIATAWRVKFLASLRTRRALAGLTKNHFVRVDDRRIVFRPVLLGNLFLFSNIDPDQCDAQTISAIERNGMRVARKAGFDPRRGYAPKVIPYRVLNDGDRPEIRTASFYHGERHRSFPGSAGMALAAFLELESGSELGREWRVHHPSGSFDVRLGFDGGARNRRLAWTEFTTPTQRLGWGSAAMPWRRGE